MRELLSAYGSRGDVEPVMGLVVRLQALGARPDFAGLRARVGVPVVTVGPAVRPMVHGSTFRSAADLAPRAAELVAAQFDTVAAAAEGCDAPVAIGVMRTGVWR